MLLHSWGGSLDRRGISDIIVNIALYIPLGFSAHLAMGKSVFRRYRVPLVAPVLLGGLLSASIEMTQLFVPGRNCSALDLLDNVIGSTLGVFAGVMFERIAGPVSPAFGGLVFVNRRPADRSALALLFIWIALLLFPLFPVTSLPGLRGKLATFADAPLFDAIPLISSALAWFAAGRLLTAAGFRHVQPSLAALLVLLPAQILIVTLQPEPAGIAGAAIAVVVFCYCGALDGVGRPLGWAFLGLLLLRGLAPFHLLAQPQSITWMPFGGFLAMNWQPGIQILIGKTFYYGTAIWLLRAGGMRMRNATALAALVLAAIEIAQRYLPGRTPEITDPIMAILAGLGIWAMAPHTRAKLKIPHAIR
jgi:VanZ family protein